MEEQYENKKGEHYDDAAGHTNDELEALVRRHLAAGDVAERPLEFVDSFTTMDGQTINVALDPERRPVLNGTVTVVDTIDVAYGVVYVIDGRLDDETLGLWETGPPESGGDEDVG